MDDAVTVKMLDSGEHLAHDVGGNAFSEFLCVDDTVEELTTWAVLHDDMDVAMVDVALIELDNVGVVDSRQDGQFFLQKLDIFGDVFAQDRLNGVSVSRVRLEGGSSDSAEVTSSNHLDEVVNGADVRRAESFFDVFEHSF